MTDSEQITSLLQTLVEQNRMLCNYLARIAAAVEQRAKLSRLSPED